MRKMFCTFVPDVFNHAIPHVINTFTCFTVS